MSEQENHNQPAAATPRRFVAFWQRKRLAQGPLTELLPAVMQRAGAAAAEVLIFDEASGAAVDFDWRGEVSDVIARAAQHPLVGSSPIPVTAEPAATETARTRRGPGRPKMGVVCREVCLLPQQWDWLEAQSGGASATLRRLVYAASHDATARRAAKRDALARMMTPLAGDLPGFEAATRALWANDDAGFRQHVAAWPEDLRDDFLARWEALAQG